MSISTTRGYRGGIKTTTGKSSASTVDSLTVTNDADIGGTLTVGGSLVVTGSYTPASVTTGALTVTGATSLNTLTASGDVTTPHMVGPITVTGDMAITGNLTYGTSSGGVTGNFSVVNGRLFVDEAGTSTTSSNATIATYNSGSTSNYVHIQTSTTGAAGTAGTLFGVNGNDTRILQRESGGDIDLECENANGNVRVRGAVLTVRKDNATTDGTFTASASIGTFRNDTSQSNYIQIQNHATGTGTGAGTVIGVVGGTSDATVRNLSSGSIILQTPGGSLTLDSSGDISFTGSLSGSVTPSLVGSTFTLTWTRAGSLSNGDYFVTKENTRYYGSFAQTRMLGWTFSSLTDGTPATTSLALSLANDQGTTISGTGMTVGSFSGSLGEPWVVNGSKNQLITAPGSLTQNCALACKVTGGSGQDTTYTVQVFLAVVTL